MTDIERELKIKKQKLIDLEERNEEAGREIRNLEDEISEIEDEIDENNREMEILEKEIDLLEQELIPEDERPIPISPGQISLKIA